MEALAKIEMDLASEDDGDFKIEALADDETARATNGTGTATVTVFELSDDEGEDDMRERDDRGEIVQDHHPDYVPETMMEPEFVGDDEVWGGEGTG